MSTVEWKKLGDLCTRNKGTNITAAQMKEIESYNGDVLVFAAGSTKVRVQKCSLPSNSVITQESIIVKSRGYIDFEYCATPFTHKNELWSYSLKDSTSILKYIFYILKVNVLYFRTTAQANSVKLPQISVSVTDDFLIPLPSLEVQQAIVNQLDTFTTLISRLESELELRQKQYEHYREVLLNFEGDEEVEWKTINSVADNYTGLTYKPTDVVNSGVLVLRSSNIKDGALSFDDNVYVDEDMNIPNRTLVKENDILICVRNGSQALVGKCALIPHIKERVAFGAFMSILRARSIHYKYLLHIWKSNLVQGQIKGNTGAPINQITSAHFKSISIPIPSKHRQQQIVSQLDTFEQLITALKREIALRKKQYEYYREKLLTFDE